MTAFKMEASLNGHLQEEIYASYLYLSMAAYCYTLGLNGFAHWMKVQSKEEWGHAMKLFDYVAERGGAIQFKEIKKPPQNFGSIPEMITKTLEHENHVTDLLNKLYETAGRLKDHATQVMLQWFIQEQVEEEAQIKAILQKFKYISDKSSAILYLDKEMGKRGEEK